MEYYKEKNVAHYKMIMLLPVVILYMSHDIFDVANFDPDLTLTLG